MLRIYLDCCAINRPLDDQRHPQIAAEAAAVRQIESLTRLAVMSPLQAIAELSL